MNPVRDCKEVFAKNKSALSVRFATVGDRKEKFAAKKSKYYLQHGNPHYGGTRGLLSSSYRRRWKLCIVMNDCVIIIIEQRQITNKRCLG